MKNLVQNGAVITVIAAAAIVSGDGVKVGTLFGVAQKDAAIGESVGIVTTGVYELPKTSAQAWTVGAAVYFNGTSGLCTTAATTGNLLIGVAVEPAANPSGTGVVRLNGSAPAAVA